MEETTLAGLHSGSSDEDTSLAPEPGRRRLSNASESSASTGITGATVSTGCNAGACCRERSGSGCSGDGAAHGHMHHRHYSEDSGEDDDMAEEPEGLLEVVGFGSGGIAEMAQELQDEEVMWALLRFELGSGSFARAKVVLLHFNGDCCPAIRRSKLNALTNDVKNELKDAEDSQGFQACVQFNQKSEVTVDNVLLTVSKFFIVDHVEEYTASWVRRDYYDQLSKETVLVKTGELTDPAADPAVHPGKLKLPHEHEHQQPELERRKTQKRDGGGPGDDDSSADAAGNGAAPAESGLAAEGEDGAAEEAAKAPEASAPDDGAAGAADGDKDGEDGEDGARRRRARIRSRSPDKGTPARRIKVPGFGDTDQNMSGRDALRALVALGSWNWVLIGPDPTELPLLGGGSGSVDEMRECALEHSDLVMFGLLRLNFGVGRLRRTKFAFLHLIGPNVSVVKRGKYNTVTSAMVEALKHYANASVSLLDMSPDELKLEEIVLRVRRMCVVDDEEIAPDGARRSLFTVEALRESLLRDQAGTEDHEYPETPVSLSSLNDLFARRGDHAEDADAERAAASSAAATASASSTAPAGAAAAPGAPEGCSVAEIAEEEEGADEDADETGEGAVGGAAPGGGGDRHRDHAGGEGSSPQTPQGGHRGSFEDGDGYIGRRKRRSLPGNHRFEVQPVVKLINSNRNCNWALFRPRLPATAANTPSASVRSPERRRSLGADCAGSAGRFGRTSGCASESPLTTPVRSPSKISFMRHLESPTCKLFEPEERAAAPLTAKAAVSALGASPAAARPPAAMSQ